MKIQADSTLIAWVSFFTLAGLGISSPAIGYLLFERFHGLDLVLWRYYLIFAGLFLFSAATIPLRNKISFVFLLISTLTCYAFYVGYAVFCFYGFHTSDDPQAVFILFWLFFIVTPYSLPFGVILPFLCIKFYLTFVDKSKA